jgi:hypothetical protein
MKALPIFESLRPEIDERKLSDALSDANMPCKVMRDGRSSVKLSPTCDKVNPEAVKSFVAGFNAGYFAF